MSIYNLDLKYNFMYNKGMKKILKKLVIVLLSVIFVVFPLSACASSWQIIDTVRFNSDVYIAVKGNEIKDKNYILDFLSQLENSISIDDNTSCVKQINNADVNTSVPITEECLDLFSLSKRYHALTNGKFNVAVRPASVLYKLSSDTFDKNAPSPFPSNSDVDAVKPLINPENFIASPADKTLSKIVSGAQIDFGGIAKGYAVDKIAYSLTQAGYTEGYINIGGSSLYIFSSQDDLKVKHPRKENDHIISINKDLIKQSSVSTSGDYEKFYLNDGKRYSHIIDGVSGMPVSTNIVSATAIGVSASFTDALTTALCCLSHDPVNKENSQLITFAKSLIEKYEFRNLSLFVVYNDGKTKLLLSNKKQGKDFTLLDNDYSVIEF